MKKRDLLLAIDTSTHAASAALYDGVSVRAEMTWESPRRHTVELAPLVVEMLERARVGSASLTGLAVAVGPGSFTGLRIGMALAKGLALALGVPIVGVPTLDVTVFPVPQRRATLLAALQAGRGRICAASYRWRRGGWRRTGDVTITTWAELVDELADGTIVCGEVDADGLAVLEAQAGRIKLLPPAQRLRRAGYLAELGWQRLRQGEHDDLATLQPVYLHTTPV